MKKYIIILAVCAILLAIANIILAIVHLQISYVFGALAMLGLLGLLYMNYRYLN